MPTTSGKPRHAFKREFAALFDPPLEGEKLSEAIASFQEKHLSKSALARISIMLAGAAGSREGILVTFPNGETRKLAPGPNEELSAFKGKVDAGAQWTRGRCISYPSTHSQIRNAETSSVMQDMRKSNRIPPLDGDCGHRFCRFRCRHLSGAHEGLRLQSCWKLLGETAPKMSPNTKKGLAKSGQTLGIVGRGGPQPALFAARCGLDKSSLILRIIGPVHTFAEQ